MGSKIFDFFGLFYLSGSYFLQNFLFSKLSYSTAESLFTKQMMVGYILTRISNQMKQIKLFRWLGTSFGSQKKNHLCLYVWMSGGSCILMQRAEPSISLKRFLKNSKLDSAQFNINCSWFDDVWCLLKIKDPYAMQMRIRLISLPNRKESP